MRRTVNVDKLESASVDLLTEAALAVLRELRKRTDRQHEYALSLNAKEETITQLNDRYMALSRAINAVSQMPTDYPHLRV